MLLYNRYKYNLIDLGFLLVFPNKNALLSKNFRTFKLQQWQSSYSPRTINIAPVISVITSSNKVIGMIANATTVMTLITYMIDVSNLVK
jgi:hypothetical protein